MLGWEFPPLINGGLGIACLGMGKAMAAHADLTFFLPKTDPEYAVANVELLGFNHLDPPAGTVSGGGTEYARFASVELIPADLLPYAEPGEPQLREGETVLSSTSAPAETAPAFGPDDLALFQGGALYGDDVGEKVIRYARVAAGLAEGRRFDVVHAHDWMTFPAGVEIKRRTGKPLVLHVHSLSYDRGGPDARGWIYDIEKSAMEEADLVIPVSRYTGTICTGHYGIDPAKVHFVHNGAEPVDAFRSEKPFPEKVVLFLGRLTGQKGPEFFLEIAAKVLEKTRDVRFVMAGTGERLRELIEAGAFRDVGDRLHFTGFLNKEKVNKLLSMTDVYVMPSVSEPFGLSALEAAQFDIPAVISKQSGVAEVLTKARMADYWDVDLMAQHISELISDPAAHRAAVEASHEDQRNCTWEAAAGRVAGLYRSELGIG
jgi:glycosyltransferase involved in cell wall biosynthesis